MNILAIIPARSGSKGVPKKNIKLLNGMPLIGYSINSAKESKFINKIIVSTDSPKIKTIAETFDIKVPFLRPKEFATDKSLDIDFIQHALEWLHVNENYIPDLIVLLRPTTPIRETIVIDDAIEKMINDAQSTSLRSAHKSSESPFKWFKIIDNYYQPIHTDFTLEDTNKPRQSFSEIFIPNGYIDIIRPQIVNLYHDVYGNKIRSFITSVTPEIDTLEEFDYLEYVVQKAKKND